MINNRQGGRRRGRGGQRSQGGNPGRGPDNGNRIDNRARGNAAQLLEKYKTLARDAQMQGDRVNTEYYLQFADHYFRVLAESRSRFEDNQPRRSNNDAFDADDGDDFDGNDLGGDDMAEVAPERHRGNGGYRGNGQQAEVNGNRAEPSVEADDQADRGNHRSDRGEAPRDAAPRGGEGRGRRGRSPRRVEGDMPEEAGAIALDVLPPALGIAPAADEADADAGDEAPAKPRRRRRVAAPEPTPAG